MSDIIRRKTKEIKVGALTVGGNAPITIQSMTDTVGFDATYAQMKALEEQGCDIVRMAVPDYESAKVLYSLKCSDIKMPIVADIHFDYKLALAAIDAGADKIRINPGNIGADDRVKAVADACRSKNLPIRVGVNSGSLSREALERYGERSAEALAHSALFEVARLEKCDFDNIVISVKSSSVPLMIKANRIISQSCDYPLHLGVTEAGGGTTGQIKGAVGIGTLISEGIGDTIRVSLSDAPEKEIECAKTILRACGAYDRPCVDVVSCPTCGRTKIDIKSLSREFEARTKDINVTRSVRVAIMGCVVNGPGEASDADFGIAGGDGEALFFREGKSVCKIPEDKIIETLMRELEKYRA